MSTAIGRIEEHVSQQLSTAEPVPSAFVGIADELHKLAALQGQGILTDAEFAEAKRLVLDGRK